MITGILPEPPSNLNEPRPSSHIIQPTMQSAACYIFKSMNSVLQTGSWLGGTPNLGGFLRLLTAAM